MQVIDNFLDDKQFDTLQSELTSWHFPWYYEKGRVTKEDGLPSLSHNFYHSNTIKSHWYETIRPIIEKNNMLAVRRIKANFDYAHDKPSQLTLHTDAVVGFEGLKTGIFYVNTNNGKTYFEDKNIVDSVANRMLIFDGKMKHGTITHTDTDTRIIINFNWY